MGTISSSRLAALLVVLSFAGVARAFPHVVAGGETPVRLAERFYGRLELERVIVAANHLDAGGGGAVVPGMRVEIPAAGYHKVAPGETWSSIAAQQLGGSSRAEVLARLNKTDPWEQPAVGREVVVPYPLRHVAVQGDTAESLAYRFLGRRDDAWMVLRYNGLADARMAPGKVVLLPIVDLPLTEAGMAAAREAGEQSRAEAGGGARERQDAAEAVLVTLADKLRHGAYLDAAVIGAGLLGQGALTDPQLVRVHAGLTEAFVALGARGLAVASCARWRKLEPHLELDPNRISPKIIAACLWEAPAPTDAAPGGP